MAPRLAILGLLVFVVSCASEAPRPAREYFDESTANTWLVVKAPLVFARERSDVAAHARDFATLVAVEVDTSGDYHQYLLLYRWSTVDPRMSATPQSGDGALRIIADDRVIELSPLAALPISLARRRELHVPNHGAVVARAYAVDARLLRFIAAARQLAVRLPREPLDVPFSLWEDGRPPLREFATRAAEP